MKNVLTLLLLAVALTASAQRIVDEPTFEFRNSSINNISKIEIKDSTRIYLYAIFRPGWWMQFNQDKIFLRDCATGEEYPITSIKGTTFGEKYVTPASGRAEFVMTFSALKDDVKKIDFVEDGSVTYGIDLIGKNKKGEPSLPGNLLLADGSNRWMYGFYPLFALIDNQKVAYEKIERKGKKTIIKTSKGLYTITPIKNLYKVEHNGKTELCSTKEIAVAGYKYPEEDFSGAIIRPDTAYVNGYIDGYSPLAGFDAGIVYLENIFSRESSPIIVPIDSTGYFEVKLPLFYPVSTNIVFNDNLWISIYIEPSKQQTLYIGWEDLLAYDRMRRKDELSGMLYMGSEGHISRELNKYKSLLRVDYKVISDKKTDPYVFKEDRMRRYEVVTDSMKKVYDSLGYPTKLKRLVDIEIKTHAFQSLLDMDMQRRDDTLARSYYDFLKEYPVNDTLMLAANRFNTFINRVEYSRYVPRYINDIKIKDSSICELLGNDGGFLRDVTLIRGFLPSILKSKRLPSEIIKSMNNAIEPYLSSSVIRQIRDEIIVQKSVDRFTPKELTEGRGAKVLHSIIDKFKGRYLLVDFWSTGCGPCRGNIERSKWMRDEMRGDSDVAFVFITSEAESPKETYDDYVSKNLLGEHVYRISTSDYLYLRELFAFNGIPHYVLMDKQGRVLENGYNSIDFKRDIENFRKR